MSAKYARAAFSEDLATYLHDGGCSKIIEMLAGE